MVRPFPFLAALLTALALVFFIVATATSHWLINYQPNVQVYEGPYNTCWRQHDVGIDECQHVNNDCTSEFSAPVDTFTVTDQCNAWRAVRAFLVLAILASALAFLVLYLASFTKLRYAPLRAPGFLLSFLAGLFGLIAWAIFISVSRSNTAYTPHAAYNDWTYGWSFALLTAAWPLQWLCILFAAIPFPYHPSAYDRARYQAEATPEEREAERQQALREGGLGASLWSALGVTADKRRGYAEKWGGGGGWGGEAEKRREAEAGREEERQAAESQRSSTVTGGSLTGGHSQHSQQSSQQLPPGMITAARTQPTQQTQMTGAQRV